MKPLIWFRCNNVAPSISLPFIIWFFLFAFATFYFPLNFLNHVFWSCMCSNIIFFLLFFSSIPHLANVFFYVVICNCACLWFLLFIFNFILFFGIFHKLIQLVPSIWFRGSNSLLLCYVKPLPKLWMSSTCGPWM